MEPQGLRYSTSGVGFGMGRPNCCEAARRAVGTLLHTGVRSHFEPESHGRIRKIMIYSCYDPRLVGHG